MRIGRMTSSLIVSGSSGRPERAGEDIERAMRPERRTERRLVPLEAASGSASRASALASLRVRYRRRSRSRPVPRRTATPTSRARLAEADAEASDSATRSELQAAIASFRRRDLAAVHLVNDKLETLGQSRRVRASAASARSTVASVQPSQTIDDLKPVRGVIELGAISDLRLDEALLVVRGDDHRHDGSRDQPTLGWNLQPANGSAAASALSASG